MQIIEFNLAVNNFEYFLFVQAGKTRKELNEPQGLFYKGKKIGVLQANARDAMVFVNIDDLPEDKNERQSLLAAIKRYVQEVWSGKTQIVLPEKFANDAVASGFNPKPNANNVIYFDKTDIAKAMDRLSKDSGHSKERSQKLRSQKTRFDKGELRLISTAEIIQQAPAIYEELFHFLNDNALFVNQTKVESGLYSAIAMKERVEYPFVETFLIQNNQNEIIGSLFINIIRDSQGAPEFAYISDSVLRGPKDEKQPLQDPLKNERDKGLGELFYKKVYEEILKKYPSLKGGWLIAGGTGLSEKGQHINMEVLGGKNLNPAEKVNTEEQFIRLGNKVAFVQFNNPVKEIKNEKEIALILKAANRGKDGRSLDSVLVPKEKAQPPRPSLR